MERRALQVYIVDDDPLMRGTLKLMLSVEGISSVGFETPGSFLDRLGDLPFGCVLLDIDMPGLDGLEVLEELTRQRPLFPVIMSSGTTNVNHAITAFRRGAIHFLRKPYSRDDLVAVLDEALTIGSARLEAENRQTQAKSIRLTTREREVLTAMTEGLQTKNIAWKLHLSIRTVDMHRSNILAKLSARNASQAVAIARGLDLLGTPAPAF
jgi:two-component system response regulator FixJ